MSRCIIHIGHAKTATTFLQSSMHLNEELFGSVGIWVPSDFRSLGYDDCRQFADQPNFSGNLAPAFWAACNGHKDAFEAFMRYFFEDPQRNILLSTELIFYYRSLLKHIVMAARSYGFSVSILAYLPRQDYASVSGYLQNIKNHGLSESILHFLSNNQFEYLRYYAILKSISSYCHPSDLIIRTFDRRFLKNGDILADFASQIDGRLDTKLFLRPSAHLNVGLQLEQYELLRALHRLGKDAEALRLSRKVIAGHGVARERNFRYYYTKELREVLIKEYYPDNTRILTEFFRDPPESERWFWTTAEAVVDPPPIDIPILAECMNHIMLAEPPEPSA